MLSPGQVGLPAKHSFFPVGEGARRLQSDLLRLEIDAALTPRAHRGQYGLRAPAVPNCVVRARSRSRLFWDLLPLLELSGCVSRTRCARLSEQRDCHHPGLRGNGSALTA